MFFFSSPLFIIIVKIDCSKASCRTESECVTVGDHRNDLCVRQANQQDAVNTWCESNRMLTRLWFLVCCNFSEFIEARQYNLD